MKRYLTRFNSLRAGKSIQSPVPPVVCLLKFQFQFPSSGKVYPKCQIPSAEKKRDLVWQRICRVSIPFERESLSKDAVNVSSKCTSWYDVSIPFERESLSKERISHHSRNLQVCFNSLRAGKSIQRKKKMKAIRIFTALVSIPFERESLSKGINEAGSKPLSWVSIPFERESLSKADAQYQPFLLPKVSIPFERESLSKGVPVANKKCA